MKFEINYFEVRHILGNNLGVCHVENVSVQVVFCLEVQY
jgi:hypothetical protein